MLYQGLFKHTDRITGNAAVIRLSGKVHIPFDRLDLLALRDAMALYQSEGFSYGECSAAASSSTGGFAPGPPLVRALAMDMVAAA